MDHRADIYSLGVVFYEMLTGELPLGKFAPPSRKVSLDIRLDEVVLHALEKEPKRRYQQASQVKTDVETIAASAQPLLTSRDETDVKHRSGISFPVVDIQGDKPRILWQGVLSSWVVVYSVIAAVDLLLWIVTKGMIPLGRSLLLGILFATITVGSGIAITLYRKRKNHDSSVAPGTPTLSIAALAGCILILFSPLIPVVATMIGVWRSSQIVIPEGRIILWGIMMVLLMSPFSLSATVLGWVAIYQIRHAQGQLYGLGLALFDGLLFPLLLLNGFIGWLIDITFFTLTIYYQWPLGGMESRVLLTLLISGVMDYWIARGLWRALKPTRMVKVSAGSVVRPPVSPQ